MEVDDDFEAIQALYLERGWTDGLPIAPPTPERKASSASSTLSPYRPSAGRLSETTSCGAPVMRPLAMPGAKMPIQKKTIAASTVPMTCASVTSSPVRNASVTDEKSGEPGLLLYANFLDYALGG